MRKSFKFYQSFSCHLGIVRYLSLGYHSQILISVMEPRTGLTFIKSGRGNLQLLIDGYRLSQNKQGLGKKNAAYFKCVERGCSARAVTIGGLDPNSMQLKFHNKAPNTHNHPSDEVANLLTQHLADFAEHARQDLSTPPKSLYDKLAEDKVGSLPSPLREEFLQRLPSFSKHRCLAYKIRQKLKGPRKYRKSHVDNSV